MIVAARRGAEAGMCYGFLWGLFWDSWSVQLFGARAFALMLAGYGAGMLKRHLDLADFVSQAVVVFLMSWVYFLFYGLLGVVFAKTFFWPGGMAFFFDPFYNAL